MPVVRGQRDASSPATTRSRPAGSRASVGRVSDLTPAPPLLPRLARNATAQFAARLTASLAQALALVLVARTLGPSTYGLFAIVTTLTVMATVVAEWGLPLIATRLIAGGGLEAGSVLAALLGLRLALGFLAGLSVVALSFAASDSGAVHLGAAIAGLSFLPLAWLGSRRSRRSSTCGSSASRGRRWAAGSRGWRGRWGRWRPARACRRWPAACS